MSEHCDNLEHSKESRVAKRILIAEDDPISRKILETTLLKWGYEVDVATDGIEAWEHLQGDDAPRLAVLDWMMPGIDGTEVVRRLRCRSGAPYVYAILLTAKSQRSDIIAGMEAGADDYVLKPFDQHELQVRVKAGHRIIDLQSSLSSTKEKMRLQTLHDPLTGLPNRLLFGDRLSDKLQRAKRLGTALSVMFLDLDQFKLINDTLGHSVGDRLLQALAERLQDTMREMDTIARMGGDEFTMILTDQTDEQGVTVVAERVLASLCAPFCIDNHELYVTGSLGISTYPSDGDDGETLVRNADAAMYRAKERGANTYQVYADAINAAAAERMQTERSLRLALENQEFELHYQLRVDLRTGLASGAEALIRWRHPQWGLVPPLRFIPVAEKCGLIEPITEWVILEACRRNKACMDAGYPPMDVAVNISPRSFHRLDLMATVQSALEITGMDPEYLNLELTEGTVMQDPDAAISILREFKDMGLHISVDDFGTGYSSLSYLRRLPIDTVKIDASFVRHLTTDPDDAAIAQAIIAMAHSLRLRVTAEGVETLEQLEFLRDMQCDEIQGYFISRPVPHEELLGLLREGLPPLVDWMPVAA